MDRKTDKLVSAIGEIDTAYLEEALDFNRTNAGRRKRTRFPKLSGATSFPPVRPSSVTQTRHR